MSDHQNADEGGPNAGASADRCGRSAAKRGPKTSHLVIGSALLLLAVGAIIGGLRAADDVRSGIQTLAWRGAWHEPPLARVCGDRRDDWLAERITAVEAFVTFTPEQQPAWARLKEALSEASRKIGEACVSLRQADGPSTPPERLQRAELMLASGLDLIQGLRPAVDGFYATLDPAQRAALDGLLRHRGHD